MERKRTAIVQRNKTKALTARMQGQYTSIRPSEFLCNIMILTMIKDTLLAFDAATSLILLSFVFVRDKKLLLC